ncbi:MAG TPA: glutamate-5-semialdehyde dehydrogenase [Anaerolineae bacterium]|nr:glutamate-5-semialdehyde dehydrogenase [Anaerolineae bacterium]
MGQNARQASRQLATLTTDKKNQALAAIADHLEAQTTTILAANAQDIDQARANNLSPHLIDRLMLDEKRVATLATDTRKIIALPDPVGSAIDSRSLPNGLHLSRRRIPIGVIGVIYEARPNVTIDIATLCLKTGNAVILRGGKETLHSNLALSQVIQDALTQVGLPPAAVQYIDNPDRALVRELMRLDKYVDMLIPRGGATLHRICREESTIPVITGGIGICHAYVDESADFKQALDIIENGKVQRPSVCNALDTVLVHQNIAANFLPELAERLAPHNVELRAAGPAYDYLSSRNPNLTITPAGPDDFDQEWLSLILGVKIVPDLDTAINHIHHHTTEHSETIITNDWRHATHFVNQLTSSAVFVNASTRFNDGGQFGLGAEVAVSTQKLHARGPMGLEELTTYKWVVYGDGHVRP